MKYLLCFLLVTAAIASAFGDDAGWSPAVNGLRARLVVLPPEKTDSPFCRVLIEMQNVEEVMGQKEIRFDPDRLELHVTDTAGKELPVAIGTYDGGSPWWEPTLLPYRGTIRFQISFPGLGSHPGIDKVIVDVGPRKAWIIPQDGSTYWLSGKFALERQKGDHPHMVWNGSIELPKVEIPKEDRAEPSSGGASAPQK